MQLKTGFQCPKKYQLTHFNIIRMSRWDNGHNSNLKYNQQYNFAYDANKEQEKLYNGKACYYTDKRFKDCHDNDTIVDDVKKNLNLKSCILKAYSVKGIPKGTIVRFSSAYLMKGYKKYDLCYRYRIEKEKPTDIQYEISDDSYFDNFCEDEKSKELVNALRQNGFLVSIRSNINALTGCEKSESILGDNGKIAIAYGFGKMIGFSSYQNSLRGYFNGCENILWDMCGHFNKWSQSRQISKSMSVDVLLPLFKTDNSLILANEIGTK
jgi:hypothetical protein